MARQTSLQSAARMSCLRPVYIQLVPEEMAVDVEFCAGANLLTFER